MTQQIENPFPVISDDHDFESWCYTKYKKVTGKLVWKIDDFSLRTEKLSSSVFSTPAPDKTEWTLHLYPTGSQESNNNYISLSVYLESSKETWATAKFSLIDNEDRVAQSQAFNQWHKFTNKKDFGFAKFVKRDYVFNKVNGVLPDDKLTIVCEIEVRLSSENRLQEFVAVKLERPSFGLVRDMGDLLSSKSLSDVTIRVGEAEFRAHKLILAARSPVFAAMFRNEMAEKKNGVVDIADIDSDVFQEMLEYVYTDKEISQTDRAKELLAAANKYQLDGLKVMCEEALCKALSADNVLENVALAQLYNCCRLKEFAVRFVMKHKSDIIGSSDWGSFKDSHHSLVMEMFEKMCFFK